MNPAVPLKAVKTQPLPRPEHRGAYYGGKWHEPRSGRHVDTINPGTGESLGKVADCGADDVDAAVAAAKKAFQEGRNVPPLERAPMLKRVAAIPREPAAEPALISPAGVRTPN